ncbi:hypothetical protein [Aquipuribacter sp. SD81]|uniref:hypothetical protein n=1 Tax=Aquipuribacter sp. SD81 TaxID=3127703 RepID=UPI003018E4E1
MTGRRSRHRVLLGLAALAAVALLGVLALLRDPGPRLPDTVAGLPAVSGGDGLAALERRLGAQPAVADVGGRVYDDGTTRAAVLLVLPREPLTDRTAAELVDGVLGTTGGPGQGTTRASADGEALLACADAGAAAGSRQVCVAVEAARAVVAVVDGLPEGPDGAPAWLDQVRTDVVAAGPSEP